MYTKMDMNQEMRRSIWLAYSGHVLLLLTLLSRVST